MDKETEQRLLEALHAVNKRLQTIERLVLYIGWAVLAFVGFYFYQVFK